MKKALSIGFILFFALLGFQCTSKKTVIQDIKNGVILKTPSLNVKVQYYTDNIVRIVKWLPGGTSDKLSLSVITDSIPALKINVRDSLNFVFLQSGKIRIELNKTSGNIRYLNSDNQDILEEGNAMLTPVVYAGDSGYTVQQNFVLSPDEGIYGLGQHQYGYMNYRGKTVKLVQSNTNAVNPFLVSTKNYGILWDNYSKTIFADTSAYASMWSDIGNNIDYYFIYGKNMDGAIAGYRELTGQAPMYGKWAYGYWQSKEHYGTQKELMDVAVKYRKLKIPIDNIVQDWDYWNGNQNWSGMFFDKSIYPRPQEMVDRLHKMNYHMMISIWPALGPNTAIYKEMQQKGYLYAPVGWAGFKYYDAFNPAANKLYWQYLKSGLYIFGIDAWWIDSTEPDVVNALTKEADEYEMKKVGRNYLGSWARYLNAYSLSMTDALYKDLRNESNKKRVYILTRSAYAGQQRNAVTTWSGDIGASWSIYKKQIAAGVNFCMSGIPYWTFDIGAYVLGSYEGVFSRGGKDPAYQELYARMFQLGTFSPIFRSHGSETPREIWEMGEFTGTLKRFDGLRYRLLPYIYSLAWKVTNEGYTIMRGLPMDFSNDKNTYDINDQFMFGPALMACPVTDYMYYTPPKASILIASKYFRTNDGKQGLDAKYYKDPDYKNLSKEQVDSNIDILWYTGRPDYVTDSMYAIRWEGKLIPDQTGKYQFQIKSFDNKHIFLDGKQLPIIYSSTEQYTDTINLVAGKEYKIVVETKNNSTGAARMKLFWKTPAILASEKEEVKKDKIREVYLPAGHSWIDFWTGQVSAGDQKITTVAPIEIMPLFVKAGSIIPMGPDIQYSTEKSADPMELRIYPGEDGSFTLYEDENDNYDYEKGIYATITFQWDNAKKELTIGDCKGEFPGMLNERVFNVVLVSEQHGVGVGPTHNPDRIVSYNGHQVKVQF
jgi:alpha-D-xyloside xylohydrolase